MSAYSSAKWRYPSEYLYLCKQQEIKEPDFMDDMDEDHEEIKTGLDIKTPSPEKRTHLYIHNEYSPYKPSYPRHMESTAAKYMKDEEPIDDTKGSLQHPTVSQFTLYPTHQDARKSEQDELAFEDRVKMSPCKTYEDF